MSERNGRKTHIDRNRYGYEVDGEFLRRVTTHLGGIAKPWLGGWAAKEVAKFAVENWKMLLELIKKGETTQAIKLLKGAPWSKRDDAADRGTAVHNAIEAFVNDDPLPDGMNEEEFDCAVAAEAFLESFVGQTLAAELTVFSFTHDYAGTLDLWCVDKSGERWILDWKTSKSVYANHAVQQVAYRNAEYAVVNKDEVGEEEWEGEQIGWGPHRAEHLGIVHVTPEKAVLHEIQPDQYDRLWVVFRAAKAIKAWLTDTDDYRGDPKVETYAEPVEFTPESATEPAPVPAN